MPAFAISSPGRAAPRTVIHSLRSAISALGVAKMQVEPGTTRGKCDDQVTRPGVLRHQPLSLRPLADRGPSADQGGVALRGRSGVWLDNPYTRAAPALIAGQGLSAMCPGRRPAGRLDPFGFYTRWAEV